jgi:hypothetical protein
MVVVVVEVEARGLFQTWMEAEVVSIVGDHSNPSSPECGDAVMVVRLSQIAASYR